MTVMFVPYRRNLRGIRGSGLRVLALIALAVVLSLALAQSEAFAQAQFYPNISTGPVPFGLHQRANAGYWQHSVGTLRPWWKNPGQYPLDPSTSPASAPIVTPGWNNSSSK